MSKALTVLSLQIGPGACYFLLVACLYLGGCSRTGSAIQVQPTILGTETVKGWTLHNADRPVAVLPSDAGLYVVGETRVYHLDRHLRVVNERSLARSPFLLAGAATPDGSRLIVCGYKGDVYLFGRGLSEQATLALEGEASAVAITENGARAYVACGDPSELVVLDCVNGKVDRRVPIGDGASSILLDEKRGTLYVGYDAERFVSCFGLPGLGENQRLPLPRPRRVRSLWASLAFGATAMALSPDGSHLYVANKGVDALTALTTRGGKPVRLSLDRPASSLALTEWGVLTDSTRLIGIKAYAEVVAADGGVVALLPTEGSIAGNGQVASDGKAVAYFAIHTDVGRNVRVSRYELK